jgi:carbamate kinase
VLGIDMMMILTAVPKIAINFGTPEQRDLDRVSLEGLRAYRAPRGNSHQAAWAPKSKPVLNSWKAAANGL